MSFSNAYYIPNSETKKYADGRSVVRMPDEFKKYQILRISALFGLNISQNTDNINKIMISGNNTAIFIDGRPMSDYEYVLNLNKLKKFYNTLHTYGLSGTKEEGRVSHKYPISVPNANVSAIGAYGDFGDPLEYIDLLNQDFENLDKTGKKSAKLQQNIETQMTSAVNFTKNTTWGKTISKSLDKFWKNNNYIFQRQGQLER